MKPINRDDVILIHSNSGAFGTSRNSKQIKNFYAGVGIVALVLILYCIRSWISNKEFNSIPNFSDLWVGMDIQMLP
jgi:hypothetical protein